MHHVDYMVNNRDGYLTISFTCSDKSSLPGHIKPSKVHKISEQHLRVEYTGTNALDFIMYVFENKPPYHHERNMNPNSNHLPFKYTLVDDLGVPPNKSRASDSGYDLNIIAARKKIGLVTLYGTGVSVEPPTGFYFDMVPRSSLIKTGYMLANSVGIIDQGYTGEIMVPLIKVDPDAPDIELPCKLVQLVPRRWHGMFPVNSNLNITGRGEGGFGSTGR
jgi:deoxyuridine 5'-triphosphate nucleotidohydrolase